MEKKVFWWQADKSEIHNKVFEHIETISVNQGYRNELNKRNLRLYGDYEAFGIFDAAFDALKPIGRLTLNVIQQCVDTACARIAKNKPKPRFLTSNGSAPMQRRAQMLERFVQGISYKNQDDKKMQNMFRSSCVFGTGAVKVFSENGEIKSELKFTPSLMVDESDAIYGNPFTLYEIQLVNKHILKEKYPQFAAEIDSAALSDFQYMVDFNSYDQVVICEAWKLPSSLDANDGRHFIGINNCTLLDKKWNRSKFPFVFCRFRPKLVGFWGEGIAELITGIQVELNKILRTIQLSMHLGAIPKLFIRRGTKIPVQHLNNEIGGVVYHDGEKPVYEPLMGIPPELRPYAQDLYLKAFEAIGLSALSVSGSKPADLESGRALREFNDIETERFALVAQDYESAHIDLWKLYIDEAKELAEENKKFAVTFLDKNGMEKIYWKDIGYKEDDFTLQCYPTNFLRTQPAGRQEDVDFLMSKGIIDLEMARDLLDFPDTEKYFQVANAKKRHIDMCIAKIVDKGEYIQPSIYLGIELLTKGIELMSNNLFYYQDKGLEPERLDLFARWISDAEAIMESVQQPMPTPEEEAMAEQMMLNPPQPQLPEPSQGELPIDLAQLSPAETVQLPQL
mgnify:CR=1 FL=1